MGKTIFKIDEDHIAWFIINRPEKRNAIDYEIMNDLKESIRLVQSNEQCKALVITGSGDKAFCSGGDLTLFHALHTKEEAYEMLSKMGEILYSLCTIQVPTVALINGIAIGGGCEIATACDFRLAKANSRVGFVQGKLNITTGWGGASMLYEKLKLESAMQMLLSADIFTGTEALKLGFIHQLLDEDDLNAECKQFLKPMLNQHRNVLTAYKTALVAKWNIAGLQQRMINEIKQCSILWEKDEHHEAVANFLNK